MPRPDRTVNSAPTSRESAEVAAEIEPSRATVRKLVNWWRVMGISETLWKKAIAWKTLAHSSRGGVGQPVDVERSGAAQRHRAAAVSGRRRDDERHADRLRRSRVEVDAPVALSVPQDLERARLGRDDLALDGA